MNEQLEALISAKGLNKEEFTAKILLQISADGVDLKAFNDDQQNRIIIAYAAGLLNG